jgi:hypothetical protein
MSLAEWDQGVLDGNMLLLNLGKLGAIAQHARLLT